MNPISTIARLMPGIVLAALLAALPAGAARAEVVPVVSSASAISRLHASELADIFLGRRDHLPDGRMVIALDGPPGSATRDEFYLQYLDRTPAQMRAYWSKLLFTGKGFPPREAVSYPALKALLQANPGSIGYLDSAALDATVKRVEIVP